MAVIARTVGRPGWYVRIRSAEIIIEHDDHEGFLQLGGEWGWNTMRRWRWKRIPVDAWRGHRRWFLASIPLPFLGRRLVLWGPTRRC